MMVLLWSFCVLSKDAVTSGQEEPGIAPLTAKVCRRLLYQLSYMPLHNILYIALYSFAATIWTVCVTKCLFYNDKVVSAAQTKHVLEVFKDTVESILK